MISSAWSRLSTGRVVSSSHSSVSFQTRTPRTRISARPAGPLRGGKSSSSRQATQTTASPCRVRTVAAPIARAARSAVSEPPPAASRRSWAARMTASQPVSRTLSRCSKTSAPRSPTETKRLATGGRPIVAIVSAQTPGLAASPPWAVAPRSSGEPGPASRPRAARPGSYVPGSRCHDRHRPGRRPGACERNRALYHHAPSARLDAAPLQPGTAPDAGPSPPPGSPHRSRTTDTPPWLQRVSRVGAADSRPEPGRSPPWC
jgi:hypothetical protein